MEVLAGSCEKLGMWDLNPAVRVRGFGSTVTGNSVNGFSLV